MPINIKDSIESSTIKGSLNGNASTATKATQDSAGQQINKTYIKGLSVSGKTITYTKGDGTTGTITTQDTNTTYSTGTASALGLTKLYTGTGTATDGTMTQNAINTALNGKANSSHGRHIPDACTAITDWNSATTNGWYMGVNATNAPTSGSDIWYFGEVVAHNTNYVIQTVYHFTASTDAKAIPKYIRAKTNGTWGAWTNVTVAKAVPSNAVFTDTNTWRGVQDNLTSTATDQSLSANQGKVLKGLVDGKANSGHTHNYAGSSSAGGAANSATKLATARTLAVTGAVTGSASFDGSANASISTSLKVPTSGAWWNGGAITSNPDGVTEVGKYLDFHNTSASTNDFDLRLQVTSANKNSVNLPTASGTLALTSDNVASATKLQTARKIGRADFNGTANIELGAIAGRATIPSSADTNANKFSKFARIDLSGGAYRSCSGTLEFIPTEGSSFTGELYYYFRTGSAITSTSIVLDWKTISNTSYAASVVAVKVSDGVYDLYYKPVGTWDTMSITNVNSIGTSYMTLYSSQGYVASVTAAATSRLNNTASATTGNAATATTLQTARTINGTSFNGSANITTANWGTARTLTIGNTGKSVNGSGNVSWSLSEIGAASSGHTHNYAGSSSAGGNANAAVKLATARTINGTSFDGSANITTANWGTARNIYIASSDGSGASSAVSVNGSGNATLKLPATIKATLSGNASTATTSNYIASNSRMDYNWNGMNYFNIEGKAGNAAKANDTPTSAWWHVMRFNHSNANGYYTDLAIPFNDVSMYYKRITHGAVNNGGWVKMLDALNYNNYAPTKTGGGASGTWGISVSGNASTATTLQTARTINGTSFNGSANITTANWGTARTLTIGNTGKSVNGSGNISWSLSEIGAAASSHSHSYLTTKGTNTISSTSSDTTANWGAQGHSIHWYTATGQLTDQPNQWGYILNLGSGTEVHQLWMTQASGDMFHRGGNNSGWSGSWRKLIDSSNYSSYALPLSGGTITGKITFANQLGGGGLSSLINCNSLHSATGNGQMLTASDNQIYLGNPRTPLVVESSKHPVVNIGGSNYTMYHSGNMAAPHWGTGNPSNSDGRPDGTVYYKYA